MKNGIVTINGPLWTTAEEWEKCDTKSERTGSDGSVAWRNSSELPISMEDLTRAELKKWWWHKYLRASI